jgi:hypothetical protein
MAHAGSSIKHSSKIASCGVADTNAGAGWTPHKNATHLHARHSKSTGANSAAWRSRPGHAGDSASAESTAPSTSTSAATAGPARVAALFISGRKPRILRWQPMVATQICGGTMGGTDFAAVFAPWQYQPCSASHNSLSQPIREFRSEPNFQNKFENLRACG